MRFVVSIDFGALFLCDSVRLLPERFNNGEKFHNVANYTNYNISLDIYSTGYRIVKRRRVKPSEELVCQLRGGRGAGAPPPGGARACPRRSGPRSEVNNSE